MVKQIRQRKKFGRYSVEEQMNDDGSTCYFVMCGGVPWGPAVVFEVTADFIAEALDLEDIQLRARQAAAQGRPVEHKPEWVVTRRGSVWGPAVVLEPTSQRIAAALDREDAALFPPASSTPVP
ncbi:MAG: hypothetical protein ACK54X_20385 [Burkholderiales bacterium]